MVLSMAHGQATQVQCYSGRSYAERPVSFVWQDRHYTVKDIESEWLEPGQKHFAVIAIRNNGEESGKRFEIHYDEREDSWSLQELS
jgi:hypothetical protein